MQKSKLWSHKDHKNTFCSIRMHYNLPFLMGKTPKNGHFLASDKRLNTAPLFLRVLDAKKQIVGTHRSRKHNLQHPYAPRSAIFYEKTASNGRFLVKSWDFLALPYFEGAGCKKADCRDTQITQTHIPASMRTKICQFS